METVNEDIWQQLERVLASTPFLDAPRSQLLLNYVITETMAGRSERLKGYTIGIDVFDRSVDFDPVSDSIVRVQASRLRKLLSTYYDGAGKTDLLVIEIPSGGYVPRFHRRSDIIKQSHSPPPDQVSESETTHQFHLRSWFSSRYGWVALAVVLIATSALLIFQAYKHNEDSAQQQPAQTQTMPVGLLGFSVSAGHAHGREIVDTLSSEFAARLGKSKIVGLVNMPNVPTTTSGEDLAALSEKNGSYFYIGGTLLHRGNEWQVRIVILDGSTGQQLWTETFPFTEQANLAAIKTLATQAAGETRIALFANAKDKLNDAALDKVGAWQLYLMATWSPGAAEDSVAWEQERVALAQRAIEISPDFGLAHSVLADKFSYLANVDSASDTKENAEAAIFHSVRTLALASDDPDAMFNWSVRLWHIGDIRTSVLALERVLEIAPDHVLAGFLVKATPYNCAPIPQSVLNELIAYDDALSPDNPARWVTLTWLNQLKLNNEQLASAFSSGAASFNIYRTPDTAMRLAATELSNGNNESAVRIYRSVKVGWPKFDAWHYAKTTIPRRCQGQPLEQRYVELYSGLARLVAGPQ